MSDPKQYPPFKVVYLYDSRNRELLGVYEAQLNPLEDGQYIAPVHSTELAPPALLAANEVSLFVNGVWEVHADYRGQTIYSQSDSSFLIVEEVGDVPLGYSLTPPPPSTTEILAYLEEAVDEYINQKAKEKGYNSVDSMSKYITITDEQVALLSVEQQTTIKMYREQCKEFVLWVATVWAFCYNSTSAVSVGTIPVPTKEQLIAALPAAPW